MTTLGSNGAEAEPWWRDEEEQHHGGARSPDLRRNSGQRRVYEVRTQGQTSDLPAAAAGG